MAIVSDAVAAATWPGQDPIGKRLKFGGLDSRNEWLTVVGVAGTTRYRELVTPRPTLYIPAEQFMISAGRLAIRSAAAPAFVAGIVDDAVRAVDPTVRVTRVAPYADYLRVPLAWPRFNALLLGIFEVRRCALGSPLRRDGAPWTPPGRDRVASRSARPEGDVQPVVLGRACG